MYSQPTAAPSRRVLTDREASFTIALLGMPRRLGKPALLASAVSARERMVTPPRSEQRNESERYSQSLSQRTTGHGSGSCGGGHAVLGAAKSGTDDVGTRAMAETSPLNGRQETLSKTVKMRRLGCQEAVIRLIAGSYPSQSVIVATGRLRRPQRLRDLACRQVHQPRSSSRPLAGQSARWSSTEPSAHVSSGASALA